MKNILSNVQNKKDDRDIGVVWKSFENNLEKIHEFNERIYGIFQNTYDEFNKLDNLFKILEEKEFLKAEESESYKNVCIQIDVLKKQFLEADNNRDNKILIEKEFKRNFDYLQLYFQEILKIDIKNIIGVKPQDLL